MSTQTPFDDELARVLRQAGPRPTPSATATAEVREALREEWRAMLKRKRRRQAGIGAAIAASIVAVLAFVLLPAPEALPVASIDRVSGSIYVSTEAGELERTADLATLRVGQSLRTGRDSVAGLMLTGGASLRVAPATSLAFLPDGVIELRAGTLYVDSRPDPLTGAPDTASSPLLIRTALGDVAHIGTQYMVDVSDQRLVVSVRSGEVVLDEAVRAVAGERLSTDGLGVDRSRIPAWGDAWQWTERAAPAIDVEQQTADVLLRWIAHETGLAIEYRDAATAGNAAKTRLSGTIDAPPREALAAWVLAADYRYEIDEMNGVIRIGRR